MAHDIEVTTIFDVSDGDGETMPLKALISMLNEAVAAMPEETRAGATVKLWCSGEYASAYFEVRRPETSAERSKREADEIRRNQRYRDEMHDAELRQYERLRMKFGG